MKISLVLDYEVELKICKLVDTTFEYMRGSIQHLTWKKIYIYIHSQKVALSYLPVHKKGLIQEPYPLPRTTGVKYRQQFSIIHIIWMRKKT